MRQEHPLIEIGRDRLLEAIRRIEFQLYFPLDWTPDPDPLERLEFALDELVRQIEHLREAATVDTLLGVNRRSAVLAELFSAVLSAGECNQNVSVLLADFDLFKAVNDTYGHGTGDVVLRDIAQRLKAAIPPDADIGRWGGEELLIVLPRRSHSDALAIASNLRRAVERKPVTTNTAVIPVTVSIGVATARGTDARIEPLLNAVDGQLYLAKSNGRNRVEGVDLSESQLSERE